MRSILFFCCSNLAVWSTCLGQGRPSNTNKVDYRILGDWVLVQEDVCDRCKKFIPKEQLLLHFKLDRTCSGVLFYWSQELNGTWAIEQDSLLITASENGQKSYGYEFLSDSVLLLHHYLPGLKAIREFRKIKLP